MTTARDILPPDSPALIVGDSPIDPRAWGAAGLAPRAVRLADCTIAELEALACMRVQSVEGERFRSAATSMLSDVYAECGNDMEARARFDALLAAKPAATFKAAATPAPRRTGPARLIIGDRRLVGV